MKLSALVTFAFVAVLSGVGIWILARRARSARAGLEEWGLGGRRLGSGLSWFLASGNLYTASTLSAAPAFIFATGGLGFYTLILTAVLYPLAFVVLPRIWTTMRDGGHITFADLVKARLGSPSLAVAVTATGIIATMPYVAVQLTGMQVTFEAMGLAGAPGDPWYVRDLALLVAFVLLAVYTFATGIKAPTAIAVLKTLLVYGVLAVAIFYLPTKLGGWASIFDKARDQYGVVDGGTSRLLVPDSGQLSFLTLAVGSALAIFMYPHAITGVLASRSATVVRRMTMVLPLFVLALGLFLLTGVMAAAYDVRPAGGNVQKAVPDLFAALVPSWFSGVVFATVVIAALVPAAMMSIGAANLFTRNVYRDLLRPRASDREQERVSRIASLAVKVGGLLFVLALNPAITLNLQLLGGIWMLQTLPAVLAALYRPSMSYRVLFAGWAVGMAYGTIVAYAQPRAGVPGTHFGSQLATVPFLGVTAYVAVTALVLNVLVVLAGHLPRLRALRRSPVWPRIQALSPRRAPSTVTTPENTV